MWYTVWCQLHILTMFFLRRRTFRYKEEADEVGGNDEHQNLESNILTTLNAKSSCMARKYTPN